MNIIAEQFPAWFQNIVFAGNTLADYLTAVGVFLAVLIVLRIFHYIILWRLAVLSRRTQTDLDDLCIDILKSFRWWFYVYLSFWVALFYLDLPVVTVGVLNSVLIILLVYQAARASSLVVEYVVEKRFSTAPDGQTDAVVDLISKLIKGAIWILGFLFVLQNLGVDVTSLVAGLGVGGIAIALALQNILSDLFSSFSIYFDKPFQVGDFIAIGDLMGTVEDIGIKTTRLRALSGEEIVLANRELTTARIQNYRDTQEWRGVFSINITYDADADTLNRVKDIITETITRMDGVRLERANAIQFAESGVQYDVSFYSETENYSAHMNNIHAIHAELKRHLDEEGVAISYPMRSVHLTKEEE